MVFASEDLTTWTEVDAGGFLTVTADNVTWTDLGRNDEAYVYLDLSATGNFTGDFTARCELTITDYDEDCNFYPIVVSDNTDDFYGLDINNRSAIGIRFWEYGAGFNSIGVDELDSGAWYSAGIDNIITENTTVYVVLTRDEAVGTYGTAYCYVYSDPAYSVLIGSISLALHTSKKDFHIVQVATSYNNGTTQELDGYLANVSFSTSICPEVSTLTATSLDYDEYAEYYHATLNANVVEAGASEVTGGFIYRDITDGSGWLGSATANGTYDTGENYSVMIYPLELGHVYEYYAYVENVACSDNGSTENFTMDLDPDVPLMQTLGYPRVLSTENLSALLYGFVLWDGTSNVTGSIQYKLSTSANWTDSTDNVTDLQSADSYSVNITGLMLYSQYDYRAVGVNDNGTGYADSYGTFTLGIEVTTPTVETGNITELTDTSCRMSGNVTDNGSGNCFGFFEYRITGTDDWSRTSGSYVDVGVTYSTSITGLSPNTDYDWRAVAWNYDINYERNYAYGDTKLFHTATSVSIPVLSTDNISYINDSTISITGSVIYDGGSPVNIWFQARELGTTTWIDSDYIIPDVETGEESTWYISGLELNHSYQVRVVGENAVGIGYGSIITFTLESGEVAGVDGSGGLEVIENFAEMVRNARQSLGMIGVMGTWAFMGLLLLIIALIFGSMIASTDDNVIKRMASIAWALISIAIVGGFLFTMQLGIWPILILVGATVVFIFIVAGSILGGRNNG